MDSGKITSAIKRATRKIIHHIVVLIFGMIIMLGAWCLPPKMLERVIQSLKPKAIVEEVLQDDPEDDEII